MIEGDSLTIPFLLTVIAGMATVIGSFLFLLIKTFHQRHLVFSLGLSAGAMIYVSFVELLRHAVDSLGMLHANLAFFFGVFLMMFLDFMLPHQYLNEREHGVAEAKLAKSGYLVAIGLAVHNFPEGMAVFLSGVSDLQLGISLAIAIGIHNIPEGVAVTMPIYYATKSKKKALSWAFVAGIFEPLGALAALWLFNDFLTESLVAYLFAFVAGIMVFISFDELLPHAYQERYHHYAISGLLLGMIVMMLSFVI